MSSVVEKQFRLRVVGYNYHPGAPKALWALRPETRLLLTPEPTNPNDPNAIQVRTTFGQMLGYIQKINAPQVLERLRDRNLLVRCYKTGDGVDTISVRWQDGDPLS